MVNQTVFLAGEEFILKRGGRMKEGIKRGRGKRGYCDAEKGHF